MRPTFARHATTKPRASKPSRAQRKPGAEEQPQVNRVALVAMLDVVHEHVVRVLARLPAPERLDLRWRLRAGIVAALSPLAPPSALEREPVDGHAPASLDADLEVIALHRRDLDAYRAQGVNVVPLRNALLALSRALRLHATNITSATAGGQSE